MRLLAGRGCLDQAAAARGGARRADNDRRRLHVLPDLARAGGALPADAGHFAGHRHRATRQTAAARAIHARHRRAGGLHVDHSGAECGQPGSGVHGHLAGQARAAAAVRGEPAADAYRDHRRRHARQCGPLSPGAAAATPGADRGGRDNVRPHAPELRHGLCSGVLLARRARRHQARTAAGSADTIRARPEYRLDGGGGEAGRLGSRADHLDAGDRRDGDARLHSARLAKSGGARRSRGALRDRSDDRTVPGIRAGRAGCPGSRGSDAGAHGSSVRAGDPADRKQRAGAARDG